MNFPADLVMTNIVRVLADKRICIVSGDTGSGKSTRIPCSLAHAFGETVVCVQPRNIAARSLATYTRGGCWVGGMRNVEDHKFLYMTNGIYNMVGNKFPHNILVIDEVHERSIQVDLILAQAKKRWLEDPHFKLVVCSATFSVEKFLTYFGIDFETSYVPIQGRMYKVDIFYEPEDSPLNYLDRNPHDQKIMDYMLLGLRSGQIKKNGNVLIFTPGCDEAETLCSDLREKQKEIQYALLRDWDIVTLHGQIEVEDQEHILKSSNPQIIVTTNIAETSLTVPRVTAVFDLGKEKVLVQSKSDVSSSDLRLQPISKASAAQRSGRAGRVQHGVCYRLYTEKEFEAFNRDRAPEILMANLNDTILSLRSDDIDIRALDMIDMPNNNDITVAEQRLMWFGALDDNYKITDMGRFMTRINVATPYAFALYQAKQNYGVEMMETLSALIAMISVQCPFYTPPDDRKKRITVEHGDKVLDNMKFFEDPLEPQSEHMMLLNVFRWCQKNRFHHSTMKKQGLFVKSMNMALEQYRAIVSPLRLKQHNKYFTWAEIFSCLYCSFTDKFVINEMGIWNWKLPSGMTPMIHPSSYIFKLLIQGETVPSLMFYSISSFTKRLYIKICSPVPQLQFVPRSDQECQDQVPSLLRLSLDTIVKESLLRPYQPNVKPHKLPYEMYMSLVERVGLYIQENKCWSSDVVEVDEI